MTFDKIALEMGLSPRTVFTLYKRALRKLRRRAVNLERMRNLAADLQLEREKRKGNYILNSLGGSN